MKKVICIVMILLSFVVFSQDQQKNVLVIHTFHSEYLWAKETQRGIESVINNDNIELYVEYLDSRRLKESIDDQVFYQFFKDKYRDIKFDSIIVADDPAFNFLRKYYHDLFEGVPVAFTGINRYYEEIEFIDQITGVIQSTNQVESIELLRKLHPQAETLIIMAANVAAGRLEIESYKEVIATYKDLKAETFLVEDYHEAEEILKQYESAAVIITNNITNKQGHLTRNLEASTYLIEKTGLPIYTVSTMYIDDQESSGTIGGYVIDPFEQGEIIAEITMKILAGQSAGDMPIMMTAPRYYLFNYHRLMEFGIKEEDLPKGSLVIGKPDGRITISRQEALVYIGLVLALILIIGILIYARHLQNLTKEVILKKNGELEQRNRLLDLKNQEIDHLIHYDPVTQFLNRPTFINELDKELQTSEDLTVYGIYIRAISNLDELYGYELGDQARGMISQKIREIFKDNLACRHYNNYYLVSHSGDYSHLIANLLNASILVEGHPIDLDGHAVIVNKHGSDNAERLVKKADVSIIDAMAKQAENIVYYDGYYHQKREGKLNTEEALKQAIRKDDFLLHYQPQVDLKTGRVVSCEALIRWQRDELVYPGDFIDIAEDAGLINSIGRLVIDKAFCAAKRFGLPVAINLSAKQINKDLVGDLNVALDKHKLSPKMIYFEITETSFMVDMKKAVLIMNQLKDMGFRIAIDDFGMGYSSLKAIVDYPLDILKIDKSFIQNIHDEKIKVIVESVIKIARAFNYDIIAEGVETEDHLELVEDLGVTIIQGWYYSKALDEDHFLGYVNKLNG